MSPRANSNPRPLSDKEAAARFVAAVVVCAMRVPQDGLHAPRRGPAPTALARQIAIYLSHTRLGFDYTTAGCAFGRDRTTVAHAVRTVESRREDPAFDAVLDVLERGVDASLLRPGAWP